VISFILVAIIMTFGCGIVWFITFPEDRPKLPHRKKDDPFAGAKEMAANRATYKKINREAMAAWEEACNCRPEVPRGYGPPIYYSESEFVALNAAVPQPMPQYSNPSSQFETYLRENYAPMPTHSDYIKMLRYKSMNDLAGRWASTPTHSRDYLRRQHNIEQYKIMHGSDGQ
jgi:hypothetical protein